MEKAIISGNVVDETGSPLSGVEVKLSLKSDITPPKYKVSDGGSIEFNTEIGQITRVYRPVYTSRDGNKKYGEEASFATESSQFDYLAQALLDYHFKDEKLILIKFMFLIPSIPIREKVITKADGSWRYRTDATNIAQYGGVNVTFSKEKYKNKSVKGVQQTIKTADENPSNNIFYDVPRVTLDLIPDLKKELISLTKIRQKIEENKIRKEELRAKLPTKAKLVNAFNEKKEAIKKILIPFIISLLIEFGTTAAQDIINKQIATIDRCPTNSKIAKLIEKRNQLVQQINNIYNSIKILDGTISTTNTFIKSLKTGIDTILALPYPAPGIPPILPPLTSGVIEKVGDTKDALKLALNKQGVIVSSLSMNLATTGALLGTITQMLNQLDSLLAQCAVDQDMDLEKLNDEINALSNSTIAQDNTYKGFKLEVKINEKNTSKFIQRFAQAVNKQGVPVLKTEPSFASDPQVLIDQLKFIIDSNPNITAE